MATNGTPGREPLRLVHHHPGRLRVRASAFRHDATPVSAVRLALAGVAAVKGIDHNGLTGSLLIRYQPGAIEPDTLLARIADAAGLDGVVDEATLRREGPDLPTRIFRAARALDQVAHEASGGRSDLRTMVPAGLFAAGLLSLVRRPRLPPWDSLLYWSYVLLVDLNQDKLRATAPSADLPR